MTESAAQSAQTVAYRALCLGALLKRGELEITLQNLRDYALAPHIEAQIEARHTEINVQLLQWLKDERLSQHLTSTESYLLKQPLKTWTERIIINTSWRIESLGVILWALNVLEEMPAFDTQFEPHEVLAPLQILTPSIDFVWCATLRSDEALRDMRERAESWLWRSRALELERLGIAPRTGISFSEIVRYMVEKGWQEGQLPAPIQGDFPAFGKPYARLNHDEYTLISSITHERFFILNWLCELNVEWESIPVDR